MMTRRNPIDWHYPIARPHAGVPLGNGMMGLLLWGDRTLRFTIARAGFWDRRGANPVLDRATYKQVKALLEANDLAGLNTLFGRDGPKAVPDRPSQYGGGRLDIELPEGTRPVRATLDLNRGQVCIELRSGSASHYLTVGQHPVEELAWTRCDSPELLERASITLTPAMETMRQSLASRGVSPPDQWTDSAGGCFVQRVPQDEPLAIAWRRSRHRVLIASALGDATGEAAINRLNNADIEHAEREADTWWTQYWSDVPKIILDDPELQQAIDLNLFKQAGLHPPHAIAATLQGCWMEEYQIPPWSNDYHFNINVQLVYGACLPTNRASHLEPLWSLVKQWLPKLREYGERFFERPGAMLLPHAVDDQCHVIGTFWSGTIDQACIAWTGQMAWLHYRHTMNESVLRDVAWPLLNGAFEGFWAMAERGADGVFKLPVSVSPEYDRDNSMAGQWGRDSSFQLAAAHMTARLLQRSAQALGRDADPRWQAFLDHLPLYSSVPERGRPDERRISVWEGHDLERSHRHHSHLASLWPFCTIDPFDVRHSRTVANTIGHWIRLGAGEWTGWCVPWASIVYARIGLATPAVLWLKWWLYAFCNEGHGTLHNADFPGPSAFNDGSLLHPNFQREKTSNWEIMQIDAAMAFTTAVCELLVQCRWTDAEPVLHILPAGLPKGWRNSEFDGIVTEGGFSIGATVRDGQLTQLRIESRYGQPLAVSADGLVGELMHAAGIDLPRPTFRVDLAPHQSIVITRPTLE